MACSTLTDEMTAGEFQATETMPTGKGDNGRRDPARKRRESSREGKVEGERPSSRLILRQAELSAMARGNSGLQAPLEPVVGPSLSQECSQQKIIAWRPRLPGCGRRGGGRAAAVLSAVLALLLWSTMELRTPAGWTSSDAPSAEDHLRPLPRRARGGETGRDAVGQQERVMPAEGSMGEPADVGPGFPDESTRGGRWVQQRVWKGHAETGFASFSAYQLSADLAVVTGLMESEKFRGDRAIHGQEHFSCEWTHTLSRASGEGEAIQGHLYAETNWPFGGVKHRLLLLFCLLQVPALAPPNGGIWRFRLGNQSLVAQPEPVVVDSQSDKSAPSNLLVFCGSPLYGEMEPQSILQWVHYHQYHIGFDHLYFYNAGGFNKGAKGGLFQYLTRGLLTVTNFKDEAQFPSAYHAQLVAMNDCLYRNRNAADWVAYGDMDEYMVVAAGTGKVPAFSPGWPRGVRTLGEFLARHCGECADISRGSYNHFLLCEALLWNPEDTVFAVEHLLYKAAAPHCTNATMDPELCLAEYGHRKVIANTKKILMMSVHEARHDLEFQPNQGPLKTCNLNAKAVFNAHYRGITVRDTGCSHVPQESEMKRWSYEVMKSTDVPEIAAKARHCVTKGTVGIVDGSCTPVRT